MVANNTFETHRDMMLQVKLYDMNGKEKLVTQVFSEIGPTNSKKYFSISRELQESAKKEGVFLVLRLLDLNKKPISDNLYWLPNEAGNYTGLQSMKPAALSVEATTASKGKIQVRLSNPSGNPVAFFNRLSLLDPQTHERLLPVFYSDNYVSVLPGEEKTILIDYTPLVNGMKPLVDVFGWNVGKGEYSIK